ncbi:MAG TPA: ATP-grasp fold amidoligase family protein [Candidatus Atribacteria bacterium]|nr:ATP-grasp fold amidoligase family protein [Candidatus Atribacteria bacterium]
MNKTVKDIVLAPMNIMYRITPALTLKTLFYIQHGYRLNLKDPKTYSEKVNWMKLYYRNDLMPLCADKYTVRDYVRDQGGAHLLNELYWQGYNPEDIPFDDLPMQFVIKVPHGSGNNIIVRDKNKLDREQTIKTMKTWLERKFIPCYGEWFYGLIKPRVIVERLLTDDKNDVPVDFKVMCFHGEPKYIRVDTDRFSGHKCNIYNTDWKLMKGYTFDHPSDERVLDRPECLDELLKEARRLSADFVHARVDFYIINNNLYFGEITFLNGAGFDRIRPYSFDLELGNLINLPERNN